MIGAMGGLERARVIGEPGRPQDQKHHCRQTDTCRPTHNIVHPLFVARPHPSPPPYVAERPGRLQVPLEQRAKAV